MKLIVDELDYYECPYFEVGMGFGDSCCSKIQDACEVYVNRLNEIYDDDECEGLIEHQKFIKEREGKYNG